ncbi:MAG: hypothetical protein COB20_15055 [SAR86 cluster bacterium]|uniref:DnaT DNA-binding domain-containing protein n=1 Tax=SAR86 cluster bacterium TaxID=2030880 RepID=A0A2A4WW92_9GAMM|nr:MAG: hypothetical protein COB20_15055 [SAR86 cluster bacterium]
MLQVLAELIHGKEICRRASNPSLDWATLSDGDFQTAFPFWATVDIRRVQNSLQNLGLIVVEAIAESRSSFYAIDEPSNESADNTSASIQAAPCRQPEVPRAVVSNPPPSIPTSGSASLIAPNWLPSPDWIKKCQQHNVPEEFVNSLIPEFVSYWRDRGQARFSWGNAFYKWVLKAWREEQTRKGAYELATQMSATWRPSEDAIGILEISGINSSFIEDAIPEFVLYWRERGMVNGAWNTKFIEHIRRQWAKFSASFGYDDTPKAIPASWQPSNDCFEILALAEIDEEYARRKIPEFVMYWKDSQQVKSSWNTVFLQFIKQDWARQLKQTESADLGYEENQSLVGSSQQRVKERFQRIADRSWAE